MLTRYLKILCNYYGPCFSSPSSVLSTFMFSHLHNSNFLPSSFCSQVRFFSHNGAPCEKLELSLILTLKYCIFLAHNQEERLGPKTDWYCENVFSQNTLNFIYIKLMSRYGFYSPPDPHLSRNRVFSVRKIWIENLNPFPPLLCGSEMVKSPKPKYVFHQI